MKTITSSRRHQYFALLSIFLITTVLIAGMAGCDPEGGGSYDLSVSSTAGGNVTTPGEGTFTYDEGATVDLVAEAEACYQFIRWIGDIVTDPNSSTTTIIMDEAKNVTANFAPVSYNLTADSTDGGEVTAPGEGAFAYDCGTVVDLVATPDAGYRFVDWTGDVGTIADVYAAATTITMNSEYSVTANFGPPAWNSTIVLQCHLTVPNEMTSLAQYVYLPWIAELEAITGTLGGEFDVNVTYGDTPYDPYESLSAISAGVIDIGQLSPENYSLGGLGYLPWLFPDIISCAYTNYYILTEGNGQWDAWKELGEVKILLSTPLWGAQYWGWAPNVTVPEDMTELDVRTEPGEVDTILALGAIPVNLSTHDLEMALKLGLVDGCFFTYSGIDSAFGLGDATFYTTELNMFYRPYALAINLGTYNSLPDEARAALDSVCGADKSVELATAHLAGEAVDKAATNADRPIYFPTQGEMNLWKAATANVDDWWAGNMTALGFDGEGILARALELIALSP